jgi:hypothetical protein
MAWPSAIAAYIRLQALRFGSKLKPPAYTQVEWRSELFDWFTSRSAKLSRAERADNASKCGPSAIGKEAAEALAHAVIPAHLKRHRPYPRHHLSIPGAAAIILQFTSPPELSGLKVGLRSVREYIRHATMYSSPAVSTSWEVVHMNRRTAPGRECHQIRVSRRP